MGRNIVIYDAVGLKNMFYHKHTFFFHWHHFSSPMSILIIKTQTHMFILISILIVANYKMYGLFYTKWLTSLGQILWTLRILMVLLALCLYLMMCFIPVYIFQIHRFLHWVLLLLLSTNVVSLRYTTVDNRKMSDLSKKSTVFFIK